VSDVTEGMMSKYVASDGFLITAKEHKDNRRFCVSTCPRTECITLHLLLAQG
jgi:hypothetical protein